MSLQEAASPGAHGQGAPATNPGRRVIGPKPRPNRRARTQEFFIPVHGPVRLFGPELAVVDHPAFQRLGEIYQLGQTHLVYRGATHKRIEHALGSVHVAQLMIEALQRAGGADPPNPDDTVGSWALDSGLRDEEIALSRLGALLHDIGHLPAGHTLEDELGLLPAHDSDQRLGVILDRQSWRGVRHRETLRELIDRAYSRPAATAAIADASGGLMTASSILMSLISKDRAEVNPPSGSGFRLSLCRDLIGNTICADLFDYLHRDWLHVGKPRYFDTRLLDYLEIRTRQLATGPDARLVVNLRGGHAVRTDGVTAILDLLESRYQLSEIALFHRTKLCAAAMLERAIAELFAATGLEAGSFEQLLVDQLLDCSDTEMLDRLIELLRTSREPTAPGVLGAIRLLESLRLRQLHKQLVAYPEYQLANRAQAVQELYVGPAAETDRTARARHGAANRIIAVRMLETDFALAPGDLAMYCPPPKMNSKIAEVQVLVHGDVDTLDGFERTHGDRGVTGGHLGAQQLRFRRLWRVAFSINPNAERQLRQRNLIQALGRAIESCVLGIQPPIGTAQEAALSLAEELTRRDGSPLHGRRVSALEAARSGELQSYPSGTPSLLSLTEANA